MISLNRPRHVPIHKVVASVPVAKAVAHPVFVVSAVAAVVHASPVLLPPQMVLIVVDKLVETCL